MHGEVESQIFGGMSGVIIVDGLSNSRPAGLRGVEERTISLKDFQDKDGAIRPGTSTATRPGPGWSTASGIRP